MHLWRLCRKRFSKDPLSGEGGLYASGRWHSAPRLVVYASESLALASLELLVHVDPDLVPGDLIAIEIDVPSRVSVTELPLSDLPKSWRSYPAPRSLQELGNAWLDGRKTAVLRVLSAAIPRERNFLINPLHRDARHIRLIGKTPFAFDPRLLRRRPGTSQGDG